VLDNAKGVLAQLEKKHMGDLSGQFRQMDLFSTIDEGALEEILALDLEGGTPEDILARLMVIIRRLKGTG
jgi:hypothetical protein